MKIHALTCGWLKAPTEAFVAGAAGVSRVPVPAFLIDHPKGRAIFDTGMPENIVADPQGAIGAYLSTIFEAEIAPGEGLAAQLHALEIDPASVDIVINSHLHFDHCAGDRLFPNARIVVQRREVEAARAAGAPDDGFDPLAMLDGRDVREIDGEFDLFGDGAVTLLPTHGHTAGHQSARLRCDGGETILAADCCYFHSTLRDRKLPPFAHDAGEMLRTLDRLAAMERAGARIVAGHDPDQWAALMRAPETMLG